MRWPLETRGYAFASLSSDTGCIACLEFPSGCKFQEDYTNKVQRIMHGIQPSIRRPHRACCVKLPMMWLLFIYHKRQMYCSKQLPIQRVWNTTWIGSCRWTSKSISNTLRRTHVTQRGNEHACPNSCIVDCTLSKASKIEPVVLLNYFFITGYESVCSTRLAFIDWIWIPFAANTIDPSKLAEQRLAAVLGGHMLQVSKV